MLPFIKKIVPKIPTGLNKPKTINYKFITGVVEECEDELNSYNNSGRLCKVVSVNTDNRFTTILIELYS